MSEIKTLGVLTSGGDAPGMNAAVRSVVRSSIHHGMRVIGIRNGYTGLLNLDMTELNLREVSDTLHRGGTFLGSARCPEFKQPEMVKKAVDIAKANGMDGLVVIGGDGSFRGARDLSLAGLPTIGIPGTIDNDIDCSEYTIGFDTALNTVNECIDKIRDTTHSHNRCTFIEVMGKNAGHIALHSAIAGGAEVMLLPEVPFDIEKDVVDQIMESRLRGKFHYLIVVAEGVGDTTKIANTTREMIKEKHNIDIETKVCILGHIQRGGKPTVKDRVVASQMGAHAVELLHKGIGNRVVAMQHNQVVDFDILEALQMKKGIDQDLYRLAEILSL